MAEHKPIRLTKAQRDRLFDYGVGVGVIAYKMADRQLSEFEFYIDRKNQMRFVGNGAPIQFEVERDEDGFETCAKVVEYDAEMQARADILNRAVEHRKRLFPDDVGNGWIDSIDRMAHEITTLRGQLAAKERELEVARLAHKATDKDRQQALDLLDQAGVWTGADMLVHDRVASLIRDWQEQQSLTDKIAKLEKQLELSRKDAHEWYTAYRQRTRGWEKLSVITKMALSPEQYKEARENAAIAHPKLFAPMEETEELL